MDIHIPEDVRRRARLKKILIWVGVTSGIVALIFAALAVWAPAVKRSEVIICRAERGDVESSVSATGHVVPATEIIVTSPVSSSILEIYCREGDEVEAATPLLKLDLQSAEDEYRRISDELTMKRNEIEQGRLNSETQLTDLEMRIRTKEMAAEQLKAQMDNERRLDSLGSGTGDRVRQAELAYRTACLEIDQMKRQLANERRVESAGGRTRELQASVMARSLDEAERTLNDAKIPAPIRGTVTYLNSSVGARIGAGERMAVISDLSRFKIEAEISEGKSDKLTVGAPVTVRVGKTDFTGRISNLTAKSSSGVVKFSVSLDNADTSRLRPGLNAQVSVIYDLREDVVRIAYDNFYIGPGEYELFVSDGGNVMERRKVMLGDASRDWIEVKSGIRPGEEVIVSGVENQRNAGTVRLK